MWCHPVLTARRTVSPRRKGRRAGWPSRSRLRQEHRKEMERQKKESEEREENGWREKRQRQERKEEMERQRKESEEKMEKLLQRLLKIPVN